MNTSNYFELAELAEASYANLWDTSVSQTITSTDKVITALEKQGFSPSQATEFTTQWRVVDHQPNTLTGMSATLFERLDASGNGTGEFTLAVRGTEPSILDPRDLIVNRQITGDSRQFHCKVTA